MGQLYEYQPTVTDQDGDALSFSLVTRPDGMGIDPSTGHLFWVPGPAQLSWVYQWTVVY